MPFGDKVYFRDKRGRFRAARFNVNNQHFKITGTLEKGLANFQFKTGTLVGEKAVEFAEKLRDYAQQHAPWEDRTGDARAGLTAEVELDDDDCIITLGHSVEYGLWLEVRWGARYAIILPTIEQIGPEIYNEMQGICSETIYYVD